MVSGERPVRASTVSQWPGAGLRLPASSRDTARLTGTRSASMARSIPARSWSVTMPSGALLPRVRSASETLSSTAPSSTSVPSQSKVMSWYGSAMVEA